MLRVMLKLLLAAAAVAAVWAFVPLGGRTMSDRWDRARSPSDFVERTWAELRGGPASAARQRPAAKAPARTQARARTQPARPTEGHTEADRKALERIVSDHLDE